MMTPFRLYQNDRLRETERDVSVVRPASGERDFLHYRWLLPDEGDDLIAFDPCLA